MSERQPQIGLSIIVPLYNEADNVVRLYRMIERALKDDARTFEIIFVDDGSQDDTLLLLRDLVARERCVRVVKLRRNFGQTAALQVGIDYARGEILVTMDGDLQNDPRDIPILVGKIDQGYDLVAGWRRNRRDRMVTRKIPSRIANFIIAKVTGVPIHDTGCSLKAYRAELLRQLPLYSDMHRFIPAMSSLATSRFAEVVVRHYPRRFGRSKYGLSRIWRVVLDVVNVKMLISFSRRPLHWFGCWSVVFFFLSAVVGCAWLVALFSSAGREGFILPLASCLLGFVGLHLLSAGVFGELVIHTEPSQRVEPLTQLFELRTKRNAIVDSCK